MNDTWKIAAVQMNPDLGQKDRNLVRILDYLEVASQALARLTVFPECALTGYCFDSREEAWPHAEEVPGPSVEALGRACRRLGVFAVMGMLERASDRLFNTCVLVGPQGLLGSYRKIHLPFLGIDRFNDPGDRPFQVWDLGGLRVGMNICYDGSFPESARVMTLLGADLIALPTNWPSGSDCAKDHMVATRAMENTVYYAAVNRVGEERGTRFIGGSRICDPLGQTLAVAGDDDAAVLYADADPARAREKQIVRVAGSHEINRIRDRRPEFYRKLVEPAGLP
ncbi:MAG: carbon-nitrogen hydrolase family protein [Planctomycetes bacterium]|nr:carbon-nitrogen hydrolase family protein [Planctomycetota bacterium]